MVTPIFFYTQRHDRTGIAIIILRAGVKAVPIFFLKTYQNMP